MENKQTAPAQPGTMTAEKTNEDFNKKQPDPKDPNEVKAETTPQVEIPDLSIRKEEKPDDLTMIRDENQPDVVKDPEILDEDAAAEVIKEDVKPDEEKVKRSNEVTM